jgi:hypothetical protein
MAHRYYTYSRVQYSSVYPRIDLVFHGQPRPLEYELVVAPGANPAPIRLSFGAADLKLKGQGSYCGALKIGERFCL